MREMNKVVLLGLLTLLILINPGDLVVEISLACFCFLILEWTKLWRGLDRGIREFCNTAKEVSTELDQQAHDTGRSAGGIFGKPAAEAMMPDNQVAELYDPAAFHNTKRQRSSRPGVLSSFLSRGWRWLCRFLGLSGCCSDGTGLYRWMAVISARMVSGFRQR